MNARLLATVALVAAEGLYRPIGGGGGGGGITQLTGDVTAGPGTGSQAATVVRLTGAGGIVTVPTATLNFGSTPSTAGTINLSNATGLFARNVGNTADLNLVRLDAANQVVIGDFSNSNVEIVVGTALLALTSGGGTFSYSGTTGTFSAGNLALNGTGSFGGGTGVVGLLPAATQPTTIPTGIVLAEAAVGLYGYQTGNSFNARLMYPVPQGTAGTQSGTVVDAFGFLSTTGATAGTILVIPLPTPSDAVGFTVNIVGRDTATEAACMLTQTVGFKNIAGTVTAFTTQGTLLLTGDAVFTGSVITYTISGTNIEVQVTPPPGAGVTAADWTAYITGAVYN